MALYWFCHWKRGVVLQIREGVLYAGFTVFLCMFQKHPSWIHLRTGVEMTKLSLSGVMNSTQLLYTLGKPTQLGCVRPQKYARKPTSARFAAEKIICFSSLQPDTRWTLHALLLLPGHSCQIEFLKSVFWRNALLSDPKRPALSICTPVLW